MLKEYPIPFSGPMVKAILEDRKTQTRRPIKPQPDELREYGGHLPEGHVFCPIGDNDAGLGMRDPLLLKCPYGQPGDRLIPAMTIPSLGVRYAADLNGNIWSKAKVNLGWKKLKTAENGKGYLTVTPAKNKKYTTKLVHRLVAETYYGRPKKNEQTRHLNGNRSDNAPQNLDWGSHQDNWTDRKYHRFLNRVPRSPNHSHWASRIDLEITKVRVERVQDITPSEILKEGAPADIKCGDTFAWFKELWDSIYAKRGFGWDENPWVWVREFKRR